MKNNNFKKIALSAFASAVLASSAFADQNVTVSSAEHNYSRSDDGNITYTGNGIYDINTTVINLGTIDGNTTSTTHNGTVRISVDQNITNTISELSDLNITAGTTTVNADVNATNITIIGAKSIPPKIVGITLLITAYTGLVNLSSICIIGLYGSG